VLELRHTTTHANYNGVPGGESAAKTTIHIKDGNVDDDAERAVNNGGDDGNDGSQIAGGDAAVARETMAVAPARSGSDRLEAVAYETAAAVVVAAAPRRRAIQSNPSLTTASSNLRASSRPPSALLRTCCPSVRMPGALSKNYETNCQLRG
jgi:hypothetical protein